MNAHKNQLLNTYALLIQCLCNKAKYHQISAVIKKTASLFHNIILVSHNQIALITNVFTAASARAITPPLSARSLPRSNFEQLRDTIESVRMWAKLIHKSAIYRPMTARGVCALPVVIDYPLRVVRIIRLFVISLEELIYIKADLVCSSGGIALKSAAVLGFGSKPTAKISQKCLCIAYAAPMHLRLQSAFQHK